MPAPGRAGVCAASLDEEEEEEEDEELEGLQRLGDLAEMEAAMAAAAADTRLTPWLVLSRGRPAWFRKSGDVTMLWVPGLQVAVANTRFPPLSKPLMGRLPPLASAWIVARGLLAMRAEFTPSIVLPVLGFSPDKLMEE